MTINLVSLLSWLPIQAFDRRVWSRIAMTTFRISMLHHPILAGLPLLLAGDIAAAAQTLASNTSQDALFRAQVRQQMQLRSLRQRIDNQNSSRRAIRSAERAAREAKQARRRALAK